VWRLLYPYIPCRPTIVVVVAGLPVVFDLVPRHTVLESLRRPRARRSSRRRRALKPCATVRNCAILWRRSVWSDDFYLVLQNITGDPSISKRAIQKALEERLFGKFNVVSLYLSLLYLIP
jgi:hypothetical protein